MVVVAAAAVAAVAAAVEIVVVVVVVVVVVDVVVLLLPPLPLPVMSCHRLTIISSMSSLRLRNCSLTTALWPNAASLLF